jgi:uncharacterized protein DUF4342
MTTTVPVTEEPKVEEPKLEPVEQKPEINYREEIQVRGEQLVAKVKELLHEGNVRHVYIKQDGHIVMEFPLTVGLVGVLAIPTLAAIGAISALIANCSIEVVRVEMPEKTPVEAPVAE